MSVLLIYPQDPSTLFLAPIVNSLKTHLENDLTVVKNNAEPGHPNYKETLEMISNCPEDQIIIFIGHGSKTCLYGGTYVKGGQQILLNLDKGSQILANKKFISLSCWSAIFIQEIETLNSSIGFGNLPTTWDDIKEARSFNKEAYKEFTVNSISIYQNKLVEIISNGLKYGLKKPYSLKQVYMYIKLHINKALSECVNGDGDHILACKLLFRLKEEMELKV